MDVGDYLVGLARHLLQIESHGQIAGRNMIRQLQEKRGLANAPDAMQQQDAIAFDQSFSYPGQQVFSSKEGGRIAYRTVGDIRVEGVPYIGLRV